MLTIGPFQISSEIKITEDQTIKAKDSGVQLQLAPPEVGEDSKHEESLDHKFTLTGSLDQSSQIYKAAMIKYH